MAHSEPRRACRHRVKWPARVRSIAETAWHPAQVLNLSVTGVLLQTEQAYEIGERVEVEIDFLTQPEIKTIVTGIGYVVREDSVDARCTAIHFDLGCTPTMGTIAPGARAARP
jgi:Tfp pilus assembly protein PilZ